MRTALLLALALLAAPASAATSATEAIQALKAMRSIVQLGTTYVDYSRRLTDATIIVDRYTDEAKSSAAKLTISTALSYYQIARALWDAKIKLGGSFPLKAIDSLRAQDCRQLKALVNKATEGRSKEELGEYATEETAELFVTTLWSCAADKIVEAEKLLGRAK